MAAAATVAGVVNAATVQVTPTAPDGWGVQVANSGEGGLEAGPATPPAGSGSAVMSLEDSHAFVLFRSTDFDGVMLAEITKLRSYFMKGVSMRSLVLALMVGAVLVADAHGQATFIQFLTLRELVTGLPYPGRDGWWGAYIYPGSPYPFGNLGGSFDVGSVCVADPVNGVWLSAGRGYGDMVAYTPTGSPFLAGQTDPSGRTELCNPLDTDDTWWFAYGDSLNFSPLLVGRFWGLDDELQKPTCDIIPTPEEGLVFLERRSADRQLYDISCVNRDPTYPLRIGTMLICSFKNTWLNTAGQNLVPELETCERYLACGNATFGPVVARGLGCGQPTPGMTPPPPVVQCSTTNRAGGNAADTRQVELATSAGTFQFDYSTYTVADQIIVTYEGQVLLDTGCVGASATHHLSYSGTSTRVQVQVIPNCAGSTDTQWDWTAHCPP
jgi:hypothetical protein